MLTNESNSAELAISPECSTFINAYFGGADQTLTTFKDMHFLLCFALEKSDLKEFDLNFIIRHVNFQQAVLDLLEEQLEGVYEKQLNVG